MRLRVITGASTLIALVAAAATPAGRPATEAPPPADRFARARTIHRALAARVPVPRAGTIWIGRAPGWLHDHATAEAALAARTEAAPSDARARIALAYLHAWRAVAAGDLESAERHVGRVLALWPGDPAALAFRDVLREHRPPTGMLAWIARLGRGGS